MSLPVGQQRKLEQIEGRLADSDPRLTSLFVIFTRLVGSEAMPWFEQIRVRPVMDRVKASGTWARRQFRRPAARIRAILLLPAALTAVMCAVMIAAGFPGAPRTAPNAKANSAREYVVKPCRLGLRLPVLSC